MASNASNAYAQQVAQIAEMKARSNATVQTVVRGVEGGFVIAGQIQYQDKDTKNVVLAENAEAVASSAADAHAKSLSYHTNGTFTAPTVDTSQSSLSFAPAQTTI